MKTLIINGHPNKSSFSGKLADAYLKGFIKSNKAVHLINLHELSFNPNLSNGYHHNVLEKDLAEAQRLINESDHLVFVYPTWWWTMPALLKGFIDRVFVPGFAFSYEKGGSFPLKLLKGKTATLIVTMDSPKWYFWLWMQNVGHVVMKRGVLDFCGIKTEKVITIDNHKHLSDKSRIKWLESVERIAVKKAGRMKSIENSKIEELVEV